MGDDDYEVSHAVEELMQDAFCGRCFSPPVWSPPSTTDRLLSLRNVIGAGGLEVNTSFTSFKHGIRYVLNLLPMTKKTSELVPIKGLRRWFTNPELAAQLGQACAAAATLEVEAEGFIAITGEFMGCVLSHGDLSAVKVLEGFTEELRLAKQATFVAAKQKIVGKLNKMMKLSPLASICESMHRGDQTTIGRAYAAYVVSSRQRRTAEHDTAVKVLAEPAGAEEATAEEEETAPEEERPEAPAAEEEAVADAAAAAETQQLAPRPRPANYMHTRVERDTRGSFTLFSPSALRDVIEAGEEPAAEPEPKPEPEPAPDFTACLQLLANSTVHEGTRATCFCCTGKYVEPHLLTCCSQTMCKQCLLDHLRAKNALICSWCSNNIKQIVPNPAALEINEVVRKIRKFKRRLKRKGDELEKGERKRVKAAAAAAAAGLAEEAL